jgi:hypothetical protein
MGFGRTQNNYHFIKIPKKSDYRRVHSFVVEPSSSSHKVINRNSIRNIYGVGGNSSELSFFSEEDSIEDDNERVCNLKL